jgi:hypothetical protein
MLVGAARNSAESADVDMHVASHGAGSRSQ